MKWPVSRDTYDIAVAQLAYFQAKAETWEQRYLAAIGPKQAVIVQKPIDPVTSAIRDAAGGNSALRGHLSHFARSEREKGTKDEVIVTKIREYVDGPQAPQKRNQADADEANAAVAELLDAE